MTVPVRTFALFGLALGMLGAGYLFVPAPGASRPLPEPVQARAAASAKPEPTLVASRPPVPLVTAPRTHLATVDRTIDSPPSDKPTVDMGTFNTNPPDPNGLQSPAQANDITQALATTADGNDGQAKRAIEFDGYRNVHDLVKGPDGSWRGRAMRGRTEIAVRVDASGSVSAE